MTHRVPLAPAEASPALRLVVWGVPLLLLVVAFVPDQGAPAPHWELLVLAAVLTAAFVVAPRRLRYTLTPDALVVTRLTGRTALPYAGMRARRTPGRLGLRTFGTGLPGHLTGHFTFGPDTVGRVLAAASRGDGGVIVESDGRAYFLTPADPDGFLHALVQRGVQVDA